jgi:hypothetical protein
MNNKYPISSIGTVNLKTGRNSMFGTVWDCWEESDNMAAILVTNDTGKFRVCVTSGNTNSTTGQFPRGHVIHLIGDQSRRNLGHWSVVGVFPHRHHGLKSIQLASGKSSLDFATFK